MAKIGGYTLKKLCQNTTIKPFDCGDADLNEFFLLKAKEYQAELLAVTYLIENDERTIGFFSIFNSIVNLEKKDFASKSALKKFMKSIVPHAKKAFGRFSRHQDRATRYL